VSEELAMRATIPPSPGRPATVDVRDMIAAHQGMRREFRLTATSVRQAADGDARQARRVAAHVRCLTTLLGHHHAGEDRLLWPKLTARAPAALAPTIAGMERQHEVIHGLLQAVDRQTTRWAARPDAAARTQLAASLSQLTDALEEHLDAEETHVLPVAAVTLSLAEWQELEEDGLKEMPKRDLAFVSGMIMYHADPACLAVLLARAPAPVRVFGSLAGPRSYARRARRVHGTATP
jgi:hemerythrin-like domain-containing protein